MIKSKMGLVKIENYDREMNSTPGDGDVSNGFFGGDVNIDGKIVHCIISQADQSEAIEDRTARYIRMRTREIDFPLPKNSRVLKLVEYDEKKRVAYCEEILGNDKLAERVLRASELEMLEIEEALEED